MSSLLKIKRSGVSGNPSTLHVGELAYSWFEGEGGHRLYIGTGEEVEGNASNHTVIGGKFFTDMLDHTAGTLTANSAIIVDSNKKINEIITPSVHNDGEMVIEGTKTIVKNLYIENGDTTLEQYVDSKVTAGKLGIEAGAGISISGEGDTKTISLTDTGVTAQQYGSATQIPVITVDSQGRITTATTAEISTTLQLSNGSETGSVDLATGSLKIVGGTGVNVTVSESTFTAQVDSSAVVMTTGAQSVAGVKTFSDMPLVTAGQGDVKTGEGNEVAKLGTVKQQTVYTDLSENGATVAIGGIEKGKKYENANIIDIINDLLHPYVAPTSVGLSITPSGGVFEMGTTKDITQGTVSWKNGSQPITKAEILVGGETKGESPVSGGTSQVVTLTAPMSVKTNTTFTARVTDSTKTTSGGNVSYTFVYPYYWGVVGADKSSLTSEEVVALTKDIRQKGNLSYNYTANNQKCVIAYPSSYGDIKTILDKNSFDVTSTFTKSQVQVTGLDGTAQAYNVYMNSASTISGFKFSFSY